MTNVQQMTDEELSRWIAEKLEPWAVESKTHPEHGHYPLCWERTAPGRPLTPRSMVTDPAMSMMLLEKLLSMQIHFTLWPQSNGTVNMTLADGINPHWQVCATFRRAIALAYALSLGDEPK